MSEHMSPAMSTPLSGSSTAPWPGACASWASTIARGPGQSIAEPGSGSSRAKRVRSWPGAASSTSRSSPARSPAATAAARGVAYLGASPKEADQSTWSQCGWVDQPATGRRPRSASHSARPARSATVTAGSISRHPPSAPITIVVVVV